MTHIVYFNLVQSLDSSHGGLDVQALHILPVLLQQGHQEVHGQVHVLCQLLLVHIDMAHCNIQAETNRGGCGICEDERKIRGGMRDISGPSPKSVFLWIFWSLVSHFKKNCTRYIQEKDSGTFCSNCELEKIDIEPCVMKKSAY